MAAVNKPILATSSQKFEIKSVFGEGREGRWEKVQQLFRDQIEPQYGTQRKLLEQLPTNESLKTRLLMIGKDSIGVLVYKTVQDDTSDKRIGRYLEFKILYTQDNTPGASECLLDHLIQIAVDHQADSICGRVARKSALIPLLRHHQFKDIEGTETDVLFCRRIRELTSGTVKRKHQDIVGAINEHTQSTEKRGVPATARSNSPTLKEEKEDDRTKRKSSQNGEDNVIKESESKRNRIDSKADKEAPVPTSYRTPSVEELRKRFEPPLPATLPPQSLPAYRPTEGIPRVLSSKDALARREKLQQAKQKSDNCPLKMQYLRMILERRKTIEGRINNGPFRNLREGSFIRFFSGQTEAYCEVVKVVRYNSFKEMLEREGIQKCLPDVQTLDAGVQIYDSIPGYKEKAQRCGVLAIHIELLQ